MAEEKPKRRRQQASRAVRRSKPTTRRDNAAELDNEDDPLAGDMHADLRANDKTGAVDHWRSEEDDAA